MEEILFLSAFWIFVFWVLWKLFLKKWFNSLATTRSAKATIQSYKIPEEVYYEMAGEEINRGQLRQGLWLKANSDALGDSQKARALYVKLRVQSMRQEAAAAINAASSGKTNTYPNPESAPEKSASPPDRVLIDCPKCNGRLRVVAHKHLEVKCAHCNHEFETHT